jgi:SOS-response transcriptional repressor LexA
MRRKPRYNLQTQVYLFYYRYLQENGFAPTYQECAVALSSHNEIVYRHVKRLVEDGFMMYAAHSHRGIEVPAYDKWLKRRVENDPAPSYMAL